MFIERKSYTDELINCINNGDVKVITGIRRCGKSILLFNLFFEKLLKKGFKKNQIIKIELDTSKDVRYKNPIVLREYVKKIVGKSKNQHFLFIDEVQMSKTVIDEESGYEVNIYSVLNELKNIKNLDIYVTGSNSKMLSKDILTEFRGRTTQIHVFPFSFKEFYEYYKGDKREALSTYLIYGGMPKLINKKDEVSKKKYLKNLFDETYMKDIVERNNIEKPEIMEEILDYLSSQIGSLTNPTTVANVLSHEKKKEIDNELVSSYINIAIDSFLLLMARRYDIKGKSYFRYPNKYYFVDPGLRNARLNFRQFDQGYLMENVIYIELLRRGYSVDVGVVIDRRKEEYRVKEIDFVINNGDKKVYVQSALEIKEETKEKSEMESLNLVKDFFKKIIIRNDIDHSYYDQNGFYHLSLINFLLGEELF